MPDYADLPLPLALRLEAQWLDAKRTMHMTSAVRTVMIAMLIPVGIAAAVFTGHESSIRILVIAGAVVYAANVVLVAYFCGAVRRGAGETIGMLMSMSGRAPARSAARH